MRRLTLARSLLIVAASAGMAGCRESEPANLSTEQVARQLESMEIEPGLWALGSEVIDVSAPDLPREIRNRMIGPRPGMRHCITPDQAASPSANFLAGRGDGACRYRAFSVEGGRIEGDMVCPDAEARMTGTYSAERYDMRMEMRSPMPGGAVMTLQVRSTGERIGACPETE